MAARSRTLFAALLVAPSLLWLATSCEQAPIFEAKGMRTATITPSLHTALTVHSELDIGVVARPLLTEVSVRVDFAITASTSSRAAALAEEVAIVQVGDDRVIGLEIFKPPMATTFTGTITIEMPAALALGVRSEMGSVVIDGVERPIEAAALNSVIVAGAADSVVALATAGGVIVDSRLLAGSTLYAEAGRGSVEVRVPNPLSAQVDIQVGESGSILIEHPDLRPLNPIETTSYSARSRGGAAAIQALSRGGSVRIRAR